MKWDSEQDATLTQLWATGMRCSEIAGNIPGASRNSVIGRAHRLRLAARPSPINGGPRRGSRSSCVKLSSVHSIDLPVTPPRKLNNGHCAPSLRIVQPADRFAPKPERQNDRAAVAAHMIELTDASMGELGTPGARALGERGPDQCRMPIGDPKVEGFRFCPRDRVQGRSYCTDHCNAAYMPPKPIESAA